VGCRQRWWEVERVGTNVLAQTMGYINGTITG
jgi:hypothetical protein